MNRTELASELARLAEDGTSFKTVNAPKELLAQASVVLQAPIDMVLHCPECGLQHIGVAAAETTGVADSPIPGTTVVAIATGDLNTEGRV